MKTAEAEVQPGRAYRNRTWGLAWPIPEYPMPHIRFGLMICFAEYALVHLDTAGSLIAYHGGEGRIIFNVTSRGRAKPVSNSPDLENRGELFPDALWIFGNIKSFGIVVRSFPHPRVLSTVSANTANWGKRQFEARMKSPRMILLRSPATSLVRFDTLMSQNSLKSGLNRLQRTFIYARP